MTYAETKVNQGGLMRCCLATIDDYAEAHADEEVTGPLTLDCQYEPQGNANIVLANNGRGWIWAWAGPRQANEIAS